MLIRSIRRGAVALTAGLVSAVTAPAIAGAETTSDPAVSAQVRQGAGDFVPLPPARILDTRFGVGGVSGSLEAGEFVIVQVAGVGGVPSADVVGVFVNLTVTGSDYDGSAFVTSPAPSVPTESLAETVVFRKGKNVPNMALVPVVDGLIAAGLHAPSVFSDGSAHLVVDVMGYLTAASNPAGSRMVSVTPSRILDTRQGLGLAAPLGSGRSVPASGTGTLQVRGVGGVPANASAVMLNLTGVSPTATTYVTAYPGDQVAPPTASNLNLEPGQIVPNVVIVQLPADGTIKLFNYDGTTNLVADVIGYFVPATSMSGNTGKIVAQDPQVEADGSGNIFDPYGPGQVKTWAFNDYSDAKGLLFNIVGVSDANGYVTVFPAESPQPLASNLNLSRGVLVSNLVAVATGPGARVSFYNFAGNTNLIEYVVGYVLP